MCELMIQLERGGVWYHLRAHALVINGSRWDDKEQEWIKHPVTPYETQQYQQKTIGAVPRLVPSV